METIILRYFNVYGNRQPLRGQYAPVIGLFMRQSENGEPMTIVGDGTQKRDFTHVSDVVDANMMIATQHIIDPSLCGEVFNVGTGKNYSINEVAGFVGGPVKHIAARPGEAYISLADNSKIRDAFNWKPRISLPEWIDQNMWPLFNQNK
jgi:UDP-glucose 4-epimerase